MTPKQLLAKAIIEADCYKIGDFTLSSGVKSNFYVDLRPMILSTKYIHLVNACLTPILEKDCHLQTNDLLCGVISSGLFLSGVLLRHLEPIREVHCIYARTEHRSHGFPKKIEGGYSAGQNVIIIDDVATSGNSISKVAAILTKSKLNVKAAVIILDRKEGASHLLKTDHCIPLYSALTIEDLKK